MHNDLPVVRQDGQIISQTFIEAEIEARDKEETATQERREATLRAAHVRADDRRRRGEDLGFEEEDLATEDAPANLADYRPMRLMLEGRVLSESNTCFWLSPEELDALVEKSGGPVRLNVKDSVQLSSHPWHCGTDSARGEILLRPSSEQAVQKLELWVKARRRWSFKCEIK